MNNSLQLHFEPTINYLNNNNNYYYSIKNYKHHHLISKTAAEFAHEKNFY